MSNKVKIVYRYIKGKATRYIKVKPSLTPNHSLVSWNEESFER